MNIVSSLLGVENIVGNGKMCGNRHFLFSHYISKSPHFGVVNTWYFVLSLYSIDTHFDASTPTAFENIVGKGEIARNKQFLFFPQCFILNQIFVSSFIHILILKNLLNLKSLELAYQVKG